MKETLILDDYTSEERRAILRELKTMKSLQPHPNVVALMGCCTLTGTQNITTLEWGLYEVQVLGRWTEVGRVVGFNLTRYVIDNFHILSYSWTMTGSQGYWLWYGHRKDSGLKKILNHFEHS